MVFLIKLIYGGQIETAIESLRIDVSRPHLKTSNLDNTVDQVFKKCKGPSCLDGIKKEAIRSILRDKVHCAKAAGLPTLLRRLEIARQDRFGPDGEPTMEQLEALVFEVESTSNYDGYEIRHIWKNSWIYSQLYKDKLEFKNTKKNGQVTPSIDKYKDSTSTSDKIAILDTVHNAAKKELYSSKASFQRLNKHLSNDFGLTKEEINQKVYIKIFQTDELPAPEKIQRKLDSIDPAIRGNAYKALFGSKQTVTALARMIEKIGSISDMDLASINDLLTHGFNTDFLGQTQDRIEREIYATKEKERDRAFEISLGLEKEYHYDTARALNHLSKLISLMRILANKKEVANLDDDYVVKIAGKLTSRLQGNENLKKMFAFNDKRSFSFENEIDNLESVLNSEIAKLVNATDANDREDLEPEEYLHFIQSKYNLD